MISSVVGCNVPSMLIRAYCLIVEFSISFLTFCLVALSIVERRVLMYPVTIVDLFLLSVLLVFVSHILQLCYLGHRHLGLLCLLGEIIPCHYITSLIFDNFVCCPIYFIYYQCRHSCFLLINVCMTYLSLLQTCLYCYI